MRALALCSVLVVGTVSGPAFAQATASFPEPGSSSRPVASLPPPVEPAAPAAPPATYSETAATGWGGAAMTAAPATAPAAATGFGWSGSWERAAPVRTDPPYRDEPAPPGYRYEDRTPAMPIVVGALILGVPYATGLGIAGAEDFANGSGWLVVPALGPWLALGARDDPCEGAHEATEFNSQVGSCVAEPIVRGMLVLDGVLQATGAVVMIVGASGSEKRLVPTQERAPRVAAMPQPVGRDGYGLGVVGSF